MKINSLNTDYNNELIITDIDDCLMLTTNSIKKHNLKIKRFYKDVDVNNKYKESVYNNAELTNWGKEFIELVSKGIIKDYILITSASNRIDILCDKFKIESKKIYEGMSNKDKIDYLNNINTKSIYIDDKAIVLNEIKNSNVKLINYPKKLIKVVKVSSNRRNRKRVITI